MDTMDYWSNHWDIRGTDLPGYPVNKLPFFEAGPWKPFAFVAFLYVLSRRWDEPKKSTRGAQPVLFLFYCFMTGAFGAGVVVGTLFFGSYQSIWNCSRMPHWAEMGLFGVLRVYSGYVALIMKVVQAVESAVLGQGILRVTLHLLEVFACYITIKYNGYDNMASAIIGHCLLVSFHYYYKAVAASGGDNKKMMGRKNLVITILSFIQSFYMVTQGVMYYNNESCRVSAGLAGLEITTGLMILLFSKYLYM